MKKILLMVCLSWAFGLAWGQEMAVDTAQADTSALVSEDFTTLHRTENSTKAAGDSAYMQNDYLSAIQIYESLLQQGESAEVYYNLGNSYYKSGDIARAILNYERALLLEPGNGDVRANLEIARTKTIDQVTPMPEIFFIGWFKSLINCLSIDAWAGWGIACFILFLACLCLFFYSKTVRLKKAGFFAGMALMVLAILCNVFALQQKKALTERDKAIVLSPSVTVRSTPSESGTSLFILHEGHKVEIKDDTMREWKEIRLEDGKVGWLPTSAIEVI